MTGSGGEVRLQVIFGRAFLLELERGNLGNAKIFARAFLMHRTRPQAAMR